MFHTGRTNSTVNEFSFIRSRIEDAIGLSDGDVAFLWRYRNRRAMCGKAAEIRGVFRMRPGAGGGPGLASLTLRARMAAARAPRRGDSRIARGGIRCAAAPERRSD
jgi:hypothetical protein